MSSASAETVRPIAEKACRDVVGHLDGNLILAATQCILQNMTKDKAIRTLTPYLASATPDFVESLWRHVENRDFNQEERRCKSKLFFEMINWSNTLHRTFVFL